MFLHTRVYDTGIPSCSIPVRFEVETRKLISIKRDKGGFSHDVICRYGTVATGDSPLLSTKNTKIKDGGKPWNRLRSSSCTHSWIGWSLWLVDCVLPDLQGWRLEVGG